MKYLVMHFRECERKVMFTCAHKRAGHVISLGVDIYVCMCVCVYVPIFCNLAN